MTPRELSWQKTQAHEKDTRAIIQRDFSASRMNTTKWTEVTAMLTQFPVLSHVKFVDVKDKVFDLHHFWHESGDWFDGSLSVFTSISIEWLDINPVEIVKNGLREPQTISHAEEIEKHLAAISVPYHWEGIFIRITGHVRKSDSE